jgi:hypothetical protein
MRVKALVKPSVSAWAINQLARKHSDAISRYLRASDRLFRAQVRGMSTKAADPDFAPAAEEQKNRLAELMGLAQEMLSAGGHGQSRTVLDRIQMTLRSAILSESARSELEAGRMTGDVGESGFDALAVQLAQAPEIEKARPAPHDEAPKIDPTQLARAAKERQEALRRVEREKKQALRELEKAAIAARRASVEGSNEAEEVRRTLTRLEARAAELEEKAALAEGERDRMRDEVVQAEEQVRTAEAEAGLS